MINDNTTDIPRKTLFKQKIFYTTIENNARNTQADLICIFTTYDRFAVNKRDAFGEGNLADFSESDFVGILSAQKLSQFI